MDYELAFSIAGMLAMLGWVLLLSSPLIPVWSDRLAGLAIPLLLSVGYVAIIVAFPAEGGGFGTLADVTVLFSQPGALLAGWVHFLAFDLVVAAWMCRQARAEGIRFWFVLPCLPIIFLFGPAGFLALSLVRPTKSIGIARLA